MKANRLAPGTPDSADESLIDKGMDLKLFIIDYKIIYNPLYCTREVIKTNKPLLLLLHNID